MDKYHSNPVDWGVRVFEVKEVHPDKTKGQTFKPFVSINASLASGKKGTEESTEQTTFQSINLTASLDAGERLVELTERGFKPEWIRFKGDYKKARTFTDEKGIVHVGHELRLHKLLIALKDGKEVYRSASLQKGGVDAPDTAPAPAPAPVSEKKKGKGNSLSA